MDDRENGTDWDKAAAGDSGGKRMIKRQAAPGSLPLGSALRDIYTETVKEAVPQEMLDLLGKLG